MNQRHQQNRPFPIPLPEPPRVVSTRLTVPDLSISSDIGSSCFKSKQKNINRQHARFETQFPRTEFVSPRKPPKTSPIINRCHVNKQSEVDVSQILKQHDQQLQMISKQIEKLLQLTSEQKPKPRMCSVETMTSNVWPSNNNKAHVHQEKASKKKVQKESTYEDVECARVDDESDDCYDQILSNIDEMLRSSDSESGESLSNPVVEEKIIRRRDHRTDRESAHQMSSETLYIKRLASKYLVCESRGSPVAVKKTSNRPKLERELQVYGITKEVSSVATKNYLQKYGLLNRPQDFSPSHGVKSGKKGNRILDLDSLKRQPKFV